MRTFKYLTFSLPKHAHIKCKRLLISWSEDRFRQIVKVVLFTAYFSSLFIFFWLFRATFCGFLVCVCKAQLPLCVKLQFFRLFIRIADMWKCTNGELRESEEKVQLLLTHDDHVKKLSNLLMLEIMTESSQRTNLASKVPRERNYPLPPPKKTNKVNVYP